MTPEELSRVREIYERALALTGAARRTFLERTEYREIREEVRRKIPASWISEMRFQCSDFRASIVSKYLAIPFCKLPLQR